MKSPRWPRVIFLSQLSWWAKESSIQERTSHPNSLLAKATPLRQFDANKWKCKSLTTLYSKIKSATLKEMRTTIKNIHFWTRQTSLQSTSIIRTLEHLISQWMATRFTSLNIKRAERSETGMANKSKSLIHHLWTPMIKLRPTHRSPKTNNKTELSIESWHQASFQILKWAKSYWTSEKSTYARQ